MMEEIISGVLSRSILGEMSRSVARAQIFVTLFMMLSSIAANSSSVAMPPSTIFLRYAAMGQKFVHSSISSALLYVEESEGECPRYAVGCDLKQRRTLALCEQLFLAGR